MEDIDYKTKEELGKIGLEFVKILMKYGYNLDYFRCSSQEGERYILTFGVYKTKRKGDWVKYLEYTGVNGNDFEI